MATEVTICNAALIHLGQMPIATLDENKKTAVLCKARFQEILDLVVYEHPWNFAINRVQLSRRSDSPTYQYGYWYDLPADYLRILETDFEAYGYKFAIEDRKLLTDVETVTIKYIKRVADMGVITPSCAEAIALKLASVLAYPLLNSQSRANEMEVIYRNHLRDCRTFDAQESREDEFNADEYTNAHSYGGLI